MKISLSITDEMNEKIEVARRKKGVTKNAYLIDLISQSLANQDLIEKVQSAFIDKLSEPHFIQDLIRDELINQK